MLNMLIYIHKENRYVLSDNHAQGQLPTPIWGPHLHRWGNAFPEAVLLIIRSVAGSLGLTHRLPPALLPWQLPFDCAEAFWALKPSRCLT